MALCLYWHYMLFLAFLLVHERSSWCYNWLQGGSGPFEKHEEEYLASSCAKFDMSGLSNPQENLQATHGPLLQRGDKTRCLSDHGLGGSSSMILFFFSFSCSVFVYGRLASKFLSFVWSWMTLFMHSLLHSKTLFISKYSYV